MSPSFWPYYSEEVGYDTEPGKIKILSEES